MSKKLPNLIIAGVVKGGTTSMFTYLSAHPDICVSNIKETCFFHGLRYGYALEPISLYESYFSHCGNQKYIVEATPGYFEGGQKLASGLKDTLGGDLKIIIFLRDPVDRLISFFKYKKSMLELPPEMSINDYILKCESMNAEEKLLQKNDMWWGVEGGKYDAYLSGWLDVFGKNLKIVFFDDMKADARGLTIELCQWLGVDASMYVTYKFEIENKSVSYKNPLLQRFALNFNASLESFWRSHPVLKGNLRDLYYSINGKPHADVISGDVRQKLMNIYMPHNNNVRNILHDHGYTKFPAWLEGGSKSNPV